MDWNSLQGTIPTSFGSALTNLRHFSIAGNRFTGSLPETLGLMVHLQVFDVSPNLFNGTLPDAFGNWRDLKTFDVSDNRYLERKVPSSYNITNWPSIQQVNVELTSVSGEVLLGSNSTSYFQMLADCGLECPCCSCCCHPPLGSPPCTEDYDILLRVECESSYFS